MRKARSFRAPENYRWIWTYDDQELAAHLEELIRDDGRIDMDELHISAQKEVIYLEGALPSEPQHQMLNFLTDIAGIQEIIDHLEIQGSPGSCSDRSKPADPQEIAAANLHQHEPYGGTDDINLTKKKASVMSHRKIHRLHRIAKISYHFARRAHGDEQFWDLRI
jgi:hypothetical protein